MKSYPSRVFIVLALMMVMLAPLSMAHAATLSLEPTSDGATVATTYTQGDFLYLNIRVDDPAGIAGAAFTLTYDATLLTPPALGADGLPLSAGDISSIFPFTYQGTNPDSDTFRANGTTAGKIYLSGAAINETTGGSLYTSGADTVLFTIKFAVKAGAATGSAFTFALSQTMLFNPAAGYGTDANSNGIYDPGSDTMDPVPVLVGALPSTDGVFGDLTKAFPVLLGNAGAPFSTVTSSTLTVVGANAISGTIAYNGPQSGTLSVSAFHTTDTAHANPIGTQQITWAAGDNSKTYAVSGIPNGTYTLAAYIDSNSNASQEAAEASGAYASPVITIANGPDGVARDFSLVNPDNDSDGMPDYWEALYGVSDAGLDADRDGYSNLQEYLNGTNPNADDPPGLAGYDPATDDGVPASPLAVTPTGTVGLAVGGTHTFTAAGGYSAYGGNVWTVVEDAPATPGDTVGSVAETVDDTKAVFTALKPGTIRVQVQDIRLDSTRSNTITVVTPITVTATGSVSSSGSLTFSATGGTGAYNWTASAGTITAAGVFTAPVVGSGTQQVTVAAYDAMFNSAHATPVKGEAIVTVYPAITLSNRWAGYVNGKPLTYPLLAFGQTTTLRAADSARRYDWSVTDWNGIERASDNTGTVSYAVNPDGLFAASGAGVYKVTVKDHDRPHLTSTYYLRVGMKISHDQASNNLNDGIAVPVVFTVKTHDTAPLVATVFNWDAKDLNGTAVTTAAAGTFADGSPTDNTNAFTVTKGIPAPISFRVTASLDATQAGSNSDVSRLIDAGLGSVTTWILRIAPMVKYSGTVVQADGVTPVVGSLPAPAVAKITALHDPAVTTAIGADGTFTIGPLADVGIPYQFIVSVTNYLDKIISSANLVKTTAVGPSPSATEPGTAIVLQSAIGGGTITGDVNLRDLVDLGGATSGNAPKTLIKVKADGVYITDDTGVAIIVMTTNNGNYTFQIPSSFATATTFTVEAVKPGYISRTMTVTNSSPPWPLLTAGGITLDPTTIITTACTEGADVTGDGVADSVECTVTAQAGSVPYRFNNTAAEAKVTMSDGSPVLMIYDVAGNAWTFTHPVYENFRFTVQADVSETLHDVAAGYRATRLAEYVKSQRAYGTVTITDPNLSGSTAPAGTPNTQVNLPPGGLSGDILDTVTIAIVEANAGVAGATGITGSAISGITMIDEDGGNVDNANLQRFEITITFDPAVVTEGSLENGTFIVYQASSMVDMAAGNYTALSPSQIIPPVDYTNGVVTFWVDHLSAFGIGVVVSSSGGGASGGGGGGGCFISTATDGLQMPAVGADRSVLLIMLVAMMPLLFALIRRRRK
ncbi:MAG: cohesin domain-containing protein [Pseudomonadota bacterium]